MYLFVVIEGNHAHMGICGQGARGCTGIDQGLVWRWIKSITLTPPAFITQPTNTLEVPITARLLSSRPEGSVLRLSLAFISGGTAWQRAVGDLSNRTGEATLWVFFSPTFPYKRQEDVEGGGEGLRIPSSQKDYRDQGN